MKKVLILVNHEIVIYNFRKELVERLLNEGFEVIISSPGGDKIDELVELGCQHSNVKLERHGTNPFNELKLIRHYKHIMKEIAPDVVLSYTIKPNIYGGIAARQHKTPYIANITGLGSAVEKKGIMQKLTVMLYKYAFSDVQKVFFQNDENMKFFADRNIVKDRHELIPGSGVNLKHFEVLDYPDSENVEFVFISRIMKEKGIDHYIGAAEYIKEKYPNTIFHVCGFCEEDYEITLDELQKKNVLIYHGMVKDIREILKSTHCTIHPTYYPEGLSNVLLESAASGRPVITTDRSGCREVVDDGVNGYIIKQKDTRNLIEKIELFLSLSNDDRKKMGLSGREKVENQFNRKIVVDAYMKEITKN